MIKRGSHLDGVEPINEKMVSNKLFFKILSNKIDSKSEVFIFLKDIVNNRVLYDKSGYSGNSTLLVNRDNLNDNEIVIKVSKKDNLYEEYIAYKYFYKLGYTSKPIKYFDCGNYEIMISNQIKLPTAGFYFNSYQQIAKYFGKELKKFHDRNLIDKGFSNEEIKIFKYKYNSAFNKAIKNDTILVYLKNYMKNEEINIEEMKKYLIKNKNILFNNLVLVHGDFNPNNIFIDENKQIQMIDFCDTGICNKHYDIFWTMFMIIIFSGILKEKDKIKECETIFLNSYGIENIDFEELKYFKYFTSLYWKQHDEITRIEIL